MITFVLLFGDGKKSTPKYSKYWLVITWSTVPHLAKLQVINKEENILLADAENMNGTSREAQLRQFLES